MHVSMVNKSSRASASSQVWALTLRWQPSGYVMYSRPLGITTEVLYMVDNCIHGAALTAWCVLADGTSNLIS